MWDEKKFFEDYKKESGQIKPDPEFVDQLVDRIKEEGERAATGKDNTVSFMNRKASRILTAAAGIAIVVSIAATGFFYSANPSGSSREIDLSQSLQAGGSGDKDGSDVIAQGDLSGSIGEADVQDDELMRLQTLLKDGRTVILDDEGNEISEEEKALLSAYAESAEQTAESPDQGAKIVRYHLKNQEEEEVILSIADHQYLLTDQDKVYRIHMESVQNH